MSDKIFHTITIPDDCCGMRLDQALAKLLPEYSRTQIKLWIDNEAVTVNQRSEKGKLRLKGGEAIQIAAEPPAPIHYTPENIPLNIVYEDDDLLVINKPVGLVVHPGAGNKERTLLNALLYYLPHLNQLPRAGILHRLDKNTSGLLLIAKTQAALKNLSHQLKKHIIKREYQAIVYGKIISGGTIDAPIGRHPLQRTHMAISETGKDAVTHYRVKEKYRFHTRLTVMLETGRTHQIRVHLAHIKYPIVGDMTYGGRMKLSKGITSGLTVALRAFKRQALHAFSISFYHPNTEEWMSITSELPEDMQSLIDSLKQDLKDAR